MKQAFIKFFPFDKTAAGVCVSELYQRYLDFIYI